MPHRGLNSSREPRVFLGTPKQRTRSLHQTSRSCHHKNNPMSCVPAKHESTGIAVSGTVDLVVFLQQGRVLLLYEVTKLRQPQEHLVQSLQRGGSEHEPIRISSLTSSPRPFTPFISGSQTVSRLIVAARRSVPPISSISIEIHYLARYTLLIIIRILYRSFGTSSELMSKIRPRQTRSTKKDSSYRGSFSAFSIPEDAAFSF